MKLIKPSFQIIKQEHLLKHIELCGRTAYKSEERTTEDSYAKFVDMLKGVNHGSVLEHGTVYLYIPHYYPDKKYGPMLDEKFNKIHNIVEFYRSNKYSKLIYKDVGLDYWITTNYRVLVENNRLEDLKYQCEPTEFHEKRYTVRFVCDRGVTREQLEDYNFKETPLDWKTELYWVEDVDGNVLGHKTTSKSKVQIDFEYYSQNNSCSIESAVIDITPRFLLTYIGTDLLREQLFDNIWVNATLSNYKPKIKEGSNYDLGDVLTDIKHLGKPYPPLEFPNWIITDVRFPNEANAIKQRGGIVIRVNRPCKECGLLNTHKMSCSKNIIEHESETALDDYNFDYIIDNSEGIDFLIEQVRIILIREGII